MNKKNKIKIIIIIIITIIIATILILNLTQNKDKQIINYLKALNFTSDENSYFYSKQISQNSLEEHNNNIKNNIESEYEILYFNTNIYTLTKNKISYNDGITKDFTPIYNYTNDKMTYTYRINLNNTNIIMEGIYDIETKEFTCNVSFAYQIDIEKSKDEICNKVKKDIEVFEYETKTLIENPKLLQYIKDKLNNK